MLDLQAHGTLNLCRNVLAWISLILRRWVCVILSNSDFRLLSIQSFSSLVNGSGGRPFHSIFFVAAGFRFFVLFDFLGFRGVFDLLSCIFDCVINRHRRYSRFLC